MVQVAANARQRDLDLNDPLMIEGVVSPYTSTVSWVFDGRRVVWVQAKDEARNWSEPYPVYAEETEPYVVYLPLVTK